MKLRLILYGLGACVALEFYLDVPKTVSVPLLLCPLSALIWFYYHPFKERDPQAVVDADGHPALGRQGFEIDPGRNP